MTPEDSQPDDIYHGVNRALRSKLGDLELKFSNLLGTLTVFRWAAAALFGIIGSVGWHTCTRAIDNEKITTVNQTKLIAMENRIIALETGGSMTSRAALAQVTDLQQRFNSFATGYEIFTREQTMSDAKIAEIINQVRVLTDFQREIQEQGSPILRQVIKDMQDIREELREQRAEVKALANVFIRYQNEKNRTDSERPKQ